MSFDAAIIAAGSEPVELPFIPHDDPRVIDSTGALDLDNIPERLLVLGGGIIGLEMACVYSELGTKISVVELMDQLIPGADKDLVTPLTKKISKEYEAIWLGTKVTAITAGPDGLTVTLDATASKDKAKAPETAVFDKVLVAVGRRPNGRVVGADAAGVFVDERGFIPVDKQQRTNVAHIFAIGDVVGQPMLAHKATHEGKVAAENTAGHTSYFDATVIPCVAYTDPEVAWVGVTENEAKAAGVKYGKGVFPWAASGRSLSLGRDEGMTKVLFDETTDRVIGAGIVGPNAGDLIAEVAAGHRDRGGRRRHRPHHPPPPHPVRDRRHGRRSLRRHHHRPLHAQEEEVRPGAPAQEQREAVHAGFGDRRGCAHTHRQAVRCAQGVHRDGARRVRDLRGPGEAAASAAARSTTSSWATSSRPAPARSPPGRPRSRAASPWTSPP